jgi:phosphoribosylanthranilate isomerase
MNVEVKICGVCSAADASLIGKLGADYVGVILAPGRSRSRSPAEAAAIYQASGGVRRVGVFVDAGVAEVRRVADLLQLHVVQLHGAEPPELAAACRADGRAVWKAVPVRATSDVERALEAYHGVVDALLLDGAPATAAGGAGVSFDWSGIAPLRARWPASLHLIAAGGLHAGNVIAAVTALRPEVVDVSSGVEAAIGVKSEERLRRFIAAARAGAADVVAR